MSDPKKSPDLPSFKTTRYELLEPLGQGAMGVVYKGRHKVLDKVVAIKCLAQSLQDDDGKFFERFRREARVLAQISHPNICSVSDFDTTDEGTTFLVMELLRGERLEDAIIRDVFTPTRAVFIASQIASALDATHQRGIVHRDLKPDNIFLIEHPDTTDFVKVLDFGIAHTDSHEGGARLTQPDTILGTPTYMSPEQAFGVVPKPASDLYSLGIILYEMLKGEPPFAGRHTLKVLQQHIHVEPPPLPPSVPPALAEIVMALLSKKPEDRPASARALVKLLESLDLSDSSAPSPAPPKTASPPNKQVSEDDDEALLGAPFDASVPSPRDTIMSLPPDDASLEDVPIDELLDMSHAPPRREAPDLEAPASAPRPRPGASPPKLELELKSPEPETHALKPKVEALSTVGHPSHKAAAIADARRSAAIEARQRLTQRLVIVAVVLIGLAFAIRALLPDREASPEPVAKPEETPSPDPEPALGPDPESLPPSQPVIRELPPPPYGPDAEQLDAALEATLSLPATTTALATLQSVDAEEDAKIIAGSALDALEPPETRHAVWLHVHIKGRDLEAARAALRALRETSPHALESRLLLALLEPLLLGDEVPGYRALFRDARSAPAVERLIVDIALYHEVLATRQRARGLLEDMTTLDPWVVAATKLRASPAEDCRKHGSPLQMLIDHEVPYSLRALEAFRVDLLAARCDAQPCCERLHEPLDELIEALSPRPSAPSHQED